MRVASTIKKGWRKLHSTFGGIGFMVLQRNSWLRDWTFYYITIKRVCILAQYGHINSLSPTSTWNKCVFFWLRLWQVAFHGSPILGKCFMENTTCDGIWIHLQHEEIPFPRDRYKVIIIMMMKVWDNLDQLVSIARVRGFLNAIFIRYNYGWSENYWGTCIGWDLWVCKEIQLQFPKSVSNKRRLEDLEIIPEKLHVWELWITNSSRELEIFKPPNSGIDNQWWRQYYISIFWRQMHDIYQYAEKRRRQVVQRRIVGVFLHIKYVSVKKTSNDSFNIRKLILATDSQLLSSNFDCHP